MKKLLKIPLLIIFFALSTIDYPCLPDRQGLSTIYAQHEGHQPGGNGLASSSQSHQMQTVKEGIKKQSPKKIYQCPMHPQVVSDKPGKCPICGMNLSEVVQEEEPTAEVPQESIVKIKESQQQLIGVKTESLISRPLMQMIRTVAKIAYDPELYKAEQEFIQAYKIKQAVNSNSSPEINKRLGALLFASQFKLKLQGLSDEQIEQLTTKTESDRSLLISDTNTPFVWAYLTIYEYDLSSIKVGDHIVLKVIAFPGEEFSGRIVAIDPVLDMNTRSVRARVQIDNPEGKLKPNMYGDAFIHIDLGEKLAVPREAVLDTGMRKLVYMDLGKGQFKAQEVELGPEAIVIVDGQERRFFPAIKGLNENDVIVTSGGFLIDSQSQLTGGMSALWGASTEIKQEGEVKTEHRH